ncbi:HNH endonuclease [Microbacterium album]|uniref:HNH nuclease domain-containing protein n=1 Tax=Microbacterium album TaxID=2053191 RepID=A0A917MK41_9MICO|nr:HNH endonuclease [Microbacterium album]GGH34102.1 hypothetical protein GCM10010921_01540 [Microbacterium album]
MTDIEARFWSKVDKSGDCWLWTAATTYGYGRFAITKRQMIGAHRFAWETVNGPVPDGMVIDHLCRIRLCVNPAHMEVVTNGENVLRGEGLSALNARKTHCKNGHEFTPENTIVTKNPSGNGRACRECRRAAWTARATCPECGGSFSARNLARHRTNQHGGSHV